MMIFKTVCGMAAAMWAYRIVTTVMEAQRGYSALGGEIFLYAGAFLVGWVLADCYAQALDYVRQKDFEEENNNDMA